MSPIDPARFVIENTALRPVPLAPEIVLRVAEESLPLWSKTEEALAEIGVPPPFWAFAWAGGQALARFVLDRPETVKGLRVLDFGAGSGLAAIAAAKAGAAKVEASEIDAFAIAAIGLNAAANGVEIAARAEDLIGADEPWDVILAADVAYERTLAEPLFAWLSRRAEAGTRVLVGDPGRTYLPKDRLQVLAEYSVPTTRELEDLAIKRTAVWRM